MSAIVEVERLFDAVGVSACGPVTWGDVSPPPDPGIYVIVTRDPAAVVIGAPARGAATAEQLALASNRWSGTQPIVYIGRAVNLRKRLKQFYAHKFGERSPHAGGQSILLLQADLSIRWTVAAGVDEIARLEDRFLTAFETLSGRDLERPFGNRMKAAQSKVSLRVSLPPYD